MNDLLKNWKEEFNKEFNYIGWIPDVKNHIQKYIESLLQAQKERDAEIVRKLQVNPWMHGQGVDIEDAFTAGGLEEMLEMYQTQVQQEILNPN